MADSIKINTFSRITPMIYAYTEPGVIYREGWTKLGYTEKQTVAQRIKQQTHTAGIHPQLEWKEFARYKNDENEGEPFTDHDFHSYIARYHDVNREEGTEWFEIEPKPAHEIFEDFVYRKIPLNTKEGSEYTLRNEQQIAVDMTKDYFASGGKEFLWNAKPRFGKTLAAYDLIQAMGAKTVLIVTNRPSIANSWLDDFRKFIGWRGEYLFVSQSNVMTGKKDVYSRQEYIDIIHQLANEGKPVPGFIVFESLQGIKGSKHFGGKYEKLHWLGTIDFDLLIIDESHEGVDTKRTLKALSDIKRKHTLFLSGTPFKALGEGRFGDHEIFNWSYADEQEAKKNWKGDSFNPYERLPRLNMFTYQMSGLIEDELKKGAAINEDETVDYAFDLNEFFRTNASGNFVYEDEVKKFIKSLTTGKKYPFSTPELRNELKHTLWLLNRVDSAKALAKLLKNDETFKDYQIVVAAGDGVLPGDELNENEDQKLNDSFGKVRRAIAENDKTITLSVGQLTVGVTIPEWSGVIMLSNMKSPASYMQAAFRAQNPHKMIGEDGQEYRKENAYVFDFDPARTLTIFDEFANNLLADTAIGGTSVQRKDHIKRLLNFFPIIGEDSNGEMVELDAAQVLSIPRKMKSQEVVRKGFLSNFLFKDIAHVFGAPKEMMEILNKLPQMSEQRANNLKHDEILDKTDEIVLDDNGEVEVSNEVAISAADEVLGPKIYEIIKEDIGPDTPEIEPDTHSKEVEKVVSGYTETVKKAIETNAVQPLVENSGLTKGQQNKIKKQVNQEIDHQFNEIKENFIDAEKSARAEMEYQQKKAETPEEFDKAQDDYNSIIAEAAQTLNIGLSEITQNLINEQPVETARNLERIKKNKEKTEIENSVRAHLRGFSRTVPSFIMAYGDDKLTLKNFDDYTEDQVFKEVTGISEEEFRMLRDGFDYTNPETGETRHYEGFFDEVVFNDSIQEFLQKRNELADYFNIANAEDIFDYIPPQKTNQIFTPKWVVKKMVDELEENDPGCFDSPDNTFADLYMKSGLYIAEIVKRLFKSEKMKEAIPDDKERIRHILEHQVYGMAPSRIIYLIATNYILGFDEELKANTKNFVQADAAEAAKEGKLQELVNQYFD